MVGGGGFFVFCGGWVGGFFFAAVAVARPLADRLRFFFQGRCYKV
jgi:hypothetical protein